MVPIATDLGLQPTNQPRYHWNRWTIARTSFRRWREWKIVSNLRHPYTTTVTGRSPTDPRSIGVALFLLALQLWIQRDKWTTAFWASKNGNLKETPPNFIIQKYNCLLKTHVKNNVSLASSGTKWWPGSCPGLLNVTVGPETSVFTGGVHSPLRSNWAV